MECTALVVYEDWHKLQARQQMKMMLRCHGITMSDEQLERLNAWVDSVVDSVKEAIHRAADALSELFKKLSEALEPTLHRVANSLKEFFDNLDLNSYDDSNTVLMKRYNRYNYLHTKQYIAQKQYYNNQFKLARMHICVANHIKR